MSAAGHRNLYMCHIVELEGGEVRESEEGSANEEDGARTSSWHSSMPLMLRMCLHHVQCPVRGIKMC